MSLKEVMDWGGHGKNVPIPLHDASPRTTQPMPTTESLVGSRDAFVADVYDITETKTPYDDDSIRGHRLEEAVLVKHRNPFCTSILGANAMRCPTVTVLGWITRENEALWGMQQR